MDVKHIIDFGIKFVTNSKCRFNFLAQNGLYNHMSDEEFIKRSYKANTGKSLNLDNPKTFNEKLQWMKLYDRNPIYNVTSDKYAVRDYVKNKIGEEYLVPFLGVWDSPEDIDFDLLPKQFVLKCNHNSGTGMCICKNKAELDIKKTRKNLQKGLNQNYFLYYREWQYKNIKRRIIAEEYLTDGINSDLFGYKIYCFNGKPEIVSIQSNDGAHMTGVSFLDKEWNLLPFYRTDHLPLDEIPEKPDNLNELLEISEKLSEEFLFVRVDLYDVNGKIYFSELTIEPCAGYNPFVPEEWDLKLGKMLKLPQKRR